jgi:hypothetical protein
MRRKVMTEMTKSTGMRENKRRKIEIAMNTKRLALGQRC